MKIHFGHRVGNTELPRDFWAGIGPLQLGVVLVFIINNFYPGWRHFSVDCYHFCIHINLTIDISVPFFSDSSMKLITSTLNIWILEPVDFS